MFMCRAKPFPRAECCGERSGYMRLMSSWLLQLISYAIVSRKYDTLHKHIFCSWPLKMLKPHTECARTTWGLSDSLFPKDVVLALKQDNMYPTLLTLQISVGINADIPCAIGSFALLIHSAVSCESICRCCITLAPRSDYKIFLSVKMFSVSD